MMGGKVAKFGIFSPAVIVAKVVLGEQKLNKVCRRVCVYVYTCVCVLVWTGFVEGEGRDGGLGGVVGWCQPSNRGFTDTHTFNKTKPNINNRLSRQHTYT